jgi:hypothetical protein
MRLCWFFFSVSLSVAAFSCGSDDDDGNTFGNGANGGQGGGAASSGTGGTINLGGSANGSGTGADGGTIFGGNEDTCDGIDNDKNGIVDDVDKGKDGICDCLKIATLGLPGEWGQGDIFATWLDARSDFGAASLNDQVLTATILDQYEVIIAQDVSKMGRSYSAEEVAALDTWVKAGHGFLTLIGYADPSELANVNLLLGPFGMSYGDQQILQKQGGSTVPVTNWVAHPVTQGVSLIGVDNGYPVQGGATLLASEGGFDMLRAATPSAGHVLMWGDEWITYDSEWSGHPDYQVELFWLNMIKWLTPANQCQVPIPPEIH